MNIMTDLGGTVTALMAPGKGLLAAEATVRCLRRTVPAAQQAPYHRARCNSAAREGRYITEVEHGGQV